MTQLQINQAITSLETLLNTLKSIRVENQTSSVKSSPTPTMYSIEEVVNVSPYKSPTSIYRILDTLDLGPSWKKDIGVGKPRLYYSQETVDQILQYIEDRDNNRGVLVAI